MHLQDEADDSELRGGNEFRYYGALDVTKLLMAALVVAIHTHPFDDLADPIIVRAATGLTSVAVPFFFIASGFLCFRKIEINHVQSRASMKRIGATIQRLLRLYIIWTAVFLPVTVLGSILEGRAVWKSALLFLRGFLLVGENFCSWPLWYLLASAVSFSLIYCLIKRGLKPSAILLFSYLCLLFGFALTWLNGSDYLPAPLHDAVNLYFILFLNVRNGLFEGFFYVSLGMALGFYEKRIIRGGVWLPMILLIAGCASTVALSSDAHLPPCGIFALGSFLLAVRVPVYRPFNKARMMSTVIYLTHMLFAVLLVYVIMDGRTYPLADNGVPGFVIYCFSLIGSALLGLLISVAADNSRLIKALFTL